MAAPGAPLPSKDRAHARALRLASVLACAAALGAARPASAAPAATAHSTPIYGVSGVSFQCGAVQTYACTGGGYGAASAAASGWPWAKYGGSYASYVGSDPHNCTLYAAYRLEQNGVSDPGWSDNADGWANDAYARGVPVDQTPAAGAIAQWNSPGTFGHVAYVESVDSGGAGMTITEDNYMPSNAAYYPGGYTARIHIASSSPAWPDNYVHFKDQAAGPPADGSFVSNSSYVYRIAGGAPIYVSNWAAVGGPQPAVALSDAEFAALPQFPRDGTVLDASGGGVFIAAGGAPLYLSNWAAIGGPKAGIGVDQAAIDNAGGGVPWNHLRSRPADGTFLDASGGGVFIAAGGAPLYLSNWSAVGGPKPGVAVDQWDVDNAGNPAAHLDPLPADGTLIVSSATGMVYEIAGGAPLYVSAWAAIGGARPAVEIDQWDLDNIANPAAHLAPVPRNGTFLNSSTGSVYRVAGGALFGVSAWSVFGGVQPFVTVDAWDVENLQNPAAHLNAVPSDGTLVEGLPSATYWSFAGGFRSPAPASGAATGVDDVGLAAYPEAPGQTDGGAAAPDGGSAVQDGGVAVQDGGAPEDGGAALDAGAEGGAAQPPKASPRAAKGGCGCNDASGAPVWVAFAALAFAALRRRRFQT